MHEKCDFRCLFSVLIILRKNFAEKQNQCGMVIIVLFLVIACKHFLEFFFSYICKKLLVTYANLRFSALVSRYTIFSNKSSNPLLPGTINSPRFNKNQLQSISKRINLQIQYYYRPRIMFTEKKKKFNNCKVFFHEKD